MFFRSYQKFWFKIGSKKKIQKFLAALDLEKYRSSMNLKNGVIGISRYYHQIISEWDQLAQHVTRIGRSPFDQFRPVIRITRFFIMFWRAHPNSRWRRFLEGTKLLYKIWLLNYFLKPRLSYNFRAEEFINLQAFEFFLKLLTKLSFQSNRN